MAPTCPHSSGGNPEFKETVSPYANLAATAVIDHPQEWLRTNIAQQNKETGAERRGHARVVNKS